MVWPGQDAGWMFDLISADPDRRGQAVRRHQELDLAAMQADDALAAIWQRAGRRPADPRLAAQIDQARAVIREAYRRCWVVTVSGWADGMEPGSAAGARLALLYLQWEAAYPAQWRASVRWSPWGLKKKVLRRFTTTAHQYGTEFRHALQDLIIAAVRREHRCEDQGYGPLARALDDTRLRAALDSAARDNGLLVRHQARFLLWALDHADIPVAPRSWQTWLSR
jgi:hypothetical protein